MKVGFTGTQQGMTQQQKIRFIRLVQKVLNIDEFHHGDCIGADYEAHNVFEYKLRDVQIIVHPPEDCSKRAYCAGHKTLPPRPYIQRNHDIVDAVELIVAIPAGPEITRSGTWATIRYARKTGIPIYVINPDGTTNAETETTNQKRRHK